MIDAPPWKRQELEDALNDQKAQVLAKGVSVLAPEPVAERIHARIHGMILNLEEIREKGIGVNLATPQARCVSALGRDWQQGSLGDGDDELVIKKLAKHLGSRNFAQQTVGHAERNKEIVAFRARMPTMIRAEVGSVELPKSFFDAITNHHIDGATLDRHEKSIVVVSFLRVAAGRWKAG